MFPTATYEYRRRVLESQFKDGLLVFLGNNESPMNYADNCYPFRQDSTFLYYFGLDQPGLAAVIDLDEGSTAIYGDELSIDDIVWMGDLPTIADRARQTGVSETRPRADFARIVGEAARAGRFVHFLPPYRADNALLLASILDASPTEIGNDASLEFILAVAAQRNIKSDEEVAEIERAVAISVEMHTAGMRMARPGMRESDIAAEVERVANAAGGGISFPVIATIRGETLHNHFHGNTLAEGDLFLLDAGAQTKMGYAGDLSSTFPVSPAFSGRQRTIYEIQLASHRAAVDLLAPGVPNRDVHFAACRVIAEGMKDLGLMKGNTEDALAAGAHAMFFPCGTGHLMGLDVHDMEDLGEVQVGWAGQPKSTQFGLKSLRLGRELEPGFVITIEPGIYFIAALVERWQGEGKCKGYIRYDKLDDYCGLGGVRIEDDVLITADGHRVLGPPIPKTVDEIEAAMA